MSAIAADAVFWEEKKFPWGDRIQEKSKYSGKPSPELDKAWHDLLNGVGSNNFCFIRPCVSDQILTAFVAENIRVDGEVIKRLGREDISVRIPGSEDFIGTLNVYHEIHCLVIDPFACKPVFEPELTFCRNDFINICTSYILPILWLSLPSVGIQSSKTRGCSVLVSAGLYIRTSG